METPVEQVIKEMLDSAGFTHQGVGKLEIAGQIVYMIDAPEDARSLIGSHGDVIHAIDALVKKITEKRTPSVENNEMTQFLVDVNEYRTKQIRDLQTKALMMAERARSFQYDVELSPMSAYERLIIHTTLSNEPSIKTESQGEGRNRRVIIRYSA